MMFQDAYETVSSLMQRGGWVMWPLLAMSVLALTLIFERCWFWFITNRPGRAARFDDIGLYLRQGQRDRALSIIDRDRSVYGRLLQRLIAENTSDAAATDIVQSLRPRIERFMPTLGTIITAAPMLGILGTVTGIISAFRVLSASQTVTDPSKISAGIAEALLTTVFGLTIALIVLFPFNAFRAQIDRTLGRFESLIAAAQEGDDDEDENETTARN
ncbi:MotA/TolQ/ExbB proton channel family protein [Planctomycetales bacterium ZRK34]|nr:MotA/TolQ/ExbB proton channel family protein [Planctomycetales bacterium ZRK34]